MRKIFLMLPLVFGMANPAVAGDPIKFEDTPPLNCHFSKGAWHCGVEVLLPEISSSLKGDSPWVSGELPKDNQVNRANGPAFKFKEVGNYSDVDWKLAEEICGEHQVALFGGTDQVSNIYDFYEDGFKKPCEIVHEHSTEEERHKKAEEDLKGKINTLEDLSRLGKVLGVFK